MMSPGWKKRPEPVPQQILVERSGGNGGCGAGGPGGVGREGACVECGRDQAGELVECRHEPPSRRQNFAAFEQRTGGGHQNPAQDRTASQLIPSLE
jgi:hypothetical protein